MDKNKLKRDLANIGKDIIVAFVIVAVIMLGLYAYCGIWPPMVVVESGSMEHPPMPGVIKSYVGVIDTGDMVFVKDVDTADDLITYVDGQATGHSTYGAFGDVIIYRPNGLESRGDGTPVVPIIHRLVVWLEINETGLSPNYDGIDYANYTFDVPSLGLYNTIDPIVLHDYGYRGDTVTIRLGITGGLLRYYQGSGIIPHSGYITMGDNNSPSYDQPYSGSYEPVQPDWIIGKAWGELPWFGLIKLWFTGAALERVASNSWNGLLGTLVFLILFPLFLEYITPVVRKIVKKDDDNDKKSDPVAGPEETTPEEIDPGKPVPDEQNEETSVPEEDQIDKRE